MTIRLPVTRIRRLAKREGFQEGWQEGELLALGQNVAETLTVGFGSVPNRRWKLLLALLAFVILCADFAKANDVVMLEAEGFTDCGGWVVDQQFMDQMGSPYLLAHGLGDPVRDASTTAQFPSTGRYRVWVRTRDWVAPWKAPGAPGRFQVCVGGRPLVTTFGTEGAEWHWQDGGIVPIERHEVKVALHDLTGFEGRCDALVFCGDLDFHPPDQLPALADFRRRSLGLPAEPEDGGHYDLVVVGGGIAGTCAAVSAARFGLRVALIQDRPVLGGNASSEVRVWPEGNTHQQPYPRVGDVVSELVAEKTRTDGNAKPAGVYDDARKLAVVRSEPGITMLLEHRVNEVATDNGMLRSVVAQQIRTGRRVRVAARWFADCTGDADVGFLAGADYETTREDHLGVSNLWRVEDTGAPEGFPQCLCKDTNALNAAFAEGLLPARFPRCPWAVDLKDKPFPGRQKFRGQWMSQGLDNLGGWFWESGYNRDPIADIEWVRDLNLRAMYGAWDVLKNVDGLYPNHRLTWAAYIAGKRESRRLLGDVVLTGDDFRTNRVFPDGCFPCSWHLDLHSPDPAFQKGHEGQEFIGRATEGANYRYAGPYWAPYRCLYSRRIPNLFMAGRDISVTHEALGAVRVMRTCGMMGEVVGMAASLCKKHAIMPRDIYVSHLEELKELLRRGAGKAPPTNGPLIPN